VPVQAPDITVIIPTIGDDRRIQTIWRAIESAGARSGAATRVLVVVNGKRFSPALMNDLRASPKVECIYLEKGSLPLALGTGRSQVRSEFFAFLDDDDEFLENGLKLRLDMLRDNPDASFVVSQGFLKSPDEETLQVGLDARAIHADPLRCLLQENWLATSASGLYRSASVTQADFESMPAYLEWTYLGFRLVSRMGFRFLDTPTYRRYDLPGSVSKSRSFNLGMVSAIKAILSLDLPSDVRRGLAHKLTLAYHNCSVVELESGRRIDAWHYHLRSLIRPGGLQFLSYTRHLLRLRAGGTAKA
jgi:glycosyltransferase involved in cell wall biosynthesis